MNYGFFNPIRLKKENLFDELAFQASSTYNIRTCRQPLKRINLSVTSHTVTKAYFDAGRLPMGLENEEIAPLLMLFLESAQDSLAVITRLASVSPLPKPSLKNALHSFKGACMTVGALHLADLAKALENQIESGIDFDSLTWLAALETAIQETTLAMRPALGESK